MNTLYNTIALQHKQSVVLNKSTYKIPARYISGLLFDISQLGYTLNSKVINTLRTLEETQFKKFHEMLVSNLKEIIGTDVKYTALFKNFPVDIPDDNEYLMKRAIGYITNTYNLVDEDIKPLSCGHIIDTRLFNIEEFGVCPICQHQVNELNDDDENRLPLSDVTPLKIIGLINEDDVKQIFTNLLAAKSSISEHNRFIIEKMIKDDPSMFTFVPNIIPMKENIAIITGLAVQYEHKGNGINYSHVASDILVSNIKTATDVLRLAVYLCNGDVSLAEATRFKLSNKNRRVIMWLLNEVNSPEEDMLRYKMRWIRLAEILHVGKYAEKYPNTFAACDTLRNRHNTIETFNSKVEKLVTKVSKGTKVSENQLVKLLVTRPGEFTRRLDWMLRTFYKKTIVITAFTKLVNQLTTPMLLTVSSHFSNRGDNTNQRCFMPKGNIAKMQIIEDERNILDDKTIVKIVKIIETELLTRFSKLDDLGNVYINPVLKNYLVPLVQRNTSKDLVTVARGSHIELMEAKSARMFIYWKQNDVDNNVDVDLSAMLYSSDWKYIKHLSFTNLSTIGGVHSGDIQSAPNGASEFIDIDIETARNNGVRYVVMNVISYTGQTFDTFQCFAGIMGREKVDSGEKFEPTTVAHKFDIAGNTKYNIPLILDLETNKIIWADMAMTSGMGSCVEAENYLGEISKTIKEMVSIKPNMFDLLMLHIKSRGETIDFKHRENKTYDVEFDIDMATKTDEILAKWL